VSGNTIFTTFNSLHRP